jgi:nitroreductase
VPQYRESEETFFMLKPAAADHPIHDLLKTRWSPLAFADLPVSSADLHTLFEAARWSPSSFNDQPWFFIVGAKNGDRETYEKLLSCAVPGNAAWASTAPVLLLAVARNTFAHNGAENRFAQYDTGQAVGTLSVQATHLGLMLHQMGGYDADKARDIFGIPDGYSPLALIALGYEGDPNAFADEKLRDRHNTSVRTRKPLTDFVLSGTWGTPSPLLPETDVSATNKES